MKDYSLLSVLLLLGYIPVSMKATLKIKKFLYEIIEQNQQGKNTALLCLCSGWLAEHSPLPSAEALLKGTSPLGRTQNITAGLPLPCFQSSGL